MRISVEPSRRASDYPFHHRIRVRFAETDAMGIVHHSRYLLYLEEARVAYLRHIGRPYPEWRAAGINATVVEVHLRYVKPLRFDDEFDVHVSLAEVGRTTFQMAYLVQRDGDSCVTGVTAHGLIDDAGRPMRLPEWLARLAVDRRDPQTGPAAAGVGSH
jgi:acyl-CoA thioester hydrolase